MNRIECKTWQEWMQSAYEHDCGKPELMACDDQGKMSFGWLCETCGDWFLLAIIDLRTTVPTDMWQFAQSSAGRQALAKTMRRFVIVIEDEEEL